MKGILRPANVQKRPSAVTPDQPGKDAAKTRYGRGTASGPKTAATDASWAGLLPYKNELSYVRLKHTDHSQGSSPSQVPNGMQRCEEQRRDGHLDVERLRQIPVDKSGKIV